MAKKLTKILSLVLVICMAFSSAACFGKKGSNNPNVLDVYMLYKGYGDEWLTPLFDSFVEQDWVKEKYPGITRSNITYSHDSNDSTPYTKLAQGASLNTYDLMFGVNLQGREDSGVLADLTDSVYLREVPGEPGVKVIDKIPQRILDRVHRVNAPEREDGNDTYHVLSYTDGLYGFIYNEYILVDQLGLSVPLTTDQFMEVGDYIKTNGYVGMEAQKYPEFADQTKNYTVIRNRANDNYMNSLYSVFWGQYEGLENVVNYYNGYDEDLATTGSRTVLFQEGRLNSLQVVEDIIRGYTDLYATDIRDNTVAQSGFLSGMGVFHYNGDYFASEMRATLANINNPDANHPYKNKIKFMKMPVISSIVEKLSFYTDGDTDYLTLSEQKREAYDQKLQMIIKDVDNNLLYNDSISKTNGISKSDFEIVAAARQIGGFAAAGGHTAVIPSYSPAKELASDFLVYMYTEQAIRSFTITSKGIVLPSTYDISADTEIMSALDMVSKSKIEMLKGTSNYEFTRLISPEATLLGKKGLTALRFEGYFEVNFHAKTQGGISAEDIIANELAYWNESSWDQTFGG